MPKAKDLEAPEAVASNTVSLLGDMGRRVLHNIVMFELGGPVDEDIAPALSVGQHGELSLRVDRQTFEALEFDR